MLNGYKLGGFGWGELKTRSGEKSVKVSVIGNYSVWGNFLYKLSGLVIGLITFLVLDPLREVSSITYEDVSRSYKLQPKFDRKCFVEDTLGVN